MPIDNHAVDADADADAADSDDAQAGTDADEQMLMLMLMLMSKWPDDQILMMLMLTGGRYICFTLLATLLYFALCFYLVCQIGSF